ncbi:bacterial type II secretion system domain protein F [Aeromicrobium marinum DSM 15272]|uniref:Bacterial type II secretion system domain protein F n=1 Tax=Aeromicrobium marinum DSM 15272 TaxID=585531 RepID=E2SE75_9ACTN|nr:type II secretion system F family protein [Aeromicrobium marinum]EFQ82802.1 bacterial type II secretion system domain protein F [Aeromicrobium marinum DSM 15272]
MGALIGLFFGWGLLLVAWAWTSPPPRRRATRPTGGRLAALLTRAGATGVPPRAVVGLCVALGSVVFVAVTAATGVPVIGLVFASMAAAAPVAVLRGRAARRLRDHAASWPDAVDNLASAVRAGMSLPEAVMQVGERGPEVLRADFVAFGRDYRATGRFEEALDLLKIRLADPVGDRVVESLRLARDVGGGDLGRMLRALSAYLRDDLRTRGELESRQSWTVNGARLAVAAPWLVLASMSLQPDVIARFGSPTGTLILVVGAATCLGAYRAMTWIGRLPTERRVLA